MRKIVLKIVLLAVFVTLCEGALLFAQSSTRTYDESEYYYFNYTIEKIYLHRLGYMVVYRRASNRLSRTYIPHEWFNTIGSGSKGEVIYLGSGREWPSMIVYFKNGEFSHVRLRVRREKTHESWGIVPLNVDMDEFFQDIEEIKMDF